MGNKIDQRGNRIYSGDSVDNSNYENEPKDYPIPKSIEE